MSFLRRFPFAFTACAACVLAACGGGGGGGGSSVVPVPTHAPSSVPSPVTSGSPTAAPSGKPGSTPTPGPVHSATPHPTPTVAPTVAPTVSPTVAPTYEPADPASVVKSSYGRIALSQIFDYFPTDGTTMGPSQIAADGSRYDTVWASFDPQAWRSANSQALVSRYYIIEEDNYTISGHNLQWWQQNHPDWILYACDSSGNPTTDIAYSPGDGFPDVPLDFENPAVISYQIQSLISYATANDYNAVALDQVLFNDFMVGGNPELGQTVKSGEYACGYYNASGAFVKLYSGPNDPQWTSDVLNWLQQAYAAAHAAGLDVMVNHGTGVVGSANEQTLLNNTDVDLDEAGFSDYGNYVNQTTGAILTQTYRYMEWAQSLGKAMVIIDRYTETSESEPTPDQVEYSIATYLLANEGNAELYVNAENSAGTGYGSEQYHQEYATPIGAPCAAMYGGSSYSSSNPQIYYRRFAGGMVVVNAGSAAPESATLPANHTYTDIEGRTVTNPLTVNSNDAYVLTTTNGCS